MRKKLLVLSTDEIFRGPLAVDILRHMAGDRYEVAMPGDPLPHPLISSVLEEIGIDRTEPGATRPDSFVSAPIDYVVTISDKTYCPVIMRAPTIHWRVQRPYADGVISMEILRQVRDQIMKHAMRFVWSEAATAART